MKSLNGFTKILFDNGFTPIENETWKKYQKHKVIDNSVIHYTQFESGCCYISDLGRIYEGMKLKHGIPDHKGYLLLGNKRVHISVMEHFGPPKPSSNHTPDHINNKRDDNRLCNLRWADKIEQSRNQSRYKHVSDLLT